MGHSASIQGAAAFTHATAVVRHQHVYGAVGLFAHAGAHAYFKIWQPSTTGARRRLGPLPATIFETLVEALDSGVRPRRDEHSAGQVHHVGLLPVKASRDTTPTQHAQFHVPSFTAPRLHRPGERGNGV